MADYDRRSNHGPRGGYNNRKRRYRGELPGQSQSGLADAYILQQMTMSTITDLNEGGTRSLCMSRPENSCWGLPNRYDTLL